MSRIDWPGPAADPAANAAEVERIIAERRACGARHRRCNQRIVVAVDRDARRDRAATIAAADRLHAARLLAGRRRAARHDGFDHGAAARSKLRVITEDVGGAFGMKSAAYPEYPVLLVAARAARPAGALDGGPLGSLHQRQPGARRGHRSRTGDGRERPIPRAAHPASRQCRRLPRLAPARMLATSEFRQMLPGDVPHSA